MNFSDFDPLKGERLQVLAPDGRADASLLPDFDETTLRRIFRQMFAARLADRRCVALQREGRLGTYPPLEGQEACQVGSALALERGDWVVPSFRELAVFLCRDVPLESILLFWMGSEAGNGIGRELRFLPVSIPVGSHTLHAAGMAMAIRYRRERDAVICYFGDGATSEGDFHEALTFAGVQKAPVIFFCQNNGWAISVPASKQCAAPALAAKGIGYGMPGIQIDGNDPFAAYLATRAALERARAGEGPTLIEAMTYRLGPHTTSDDPSRYRDAAEVEKLRQLEPLKRYRLFLQERGLWSEAWEAELAAEVEEWLGAAVQKAEAHPAPNPEEVFATMFAELPPHLREQRDELLAALKEGMRMAQMNMVEAINLALAEELERDPDVVLLGEDVGKEGGVFRVTEGLQQRFGAERSVDTPLAESGIVGVALGMAMMGLRPVAEIQFMGFLYPAFDQIISHVGRMRNRTRGVYTAPLVIRMPYGGGIHAPEHHSESTEAILVHTPGIKVVIPATPRDAFGLLKSAIRDPDPVLFLEPKRIYRAIKEEVAGGEALVPIGKARLVRQGTDLTLVAWGSLVREVEKAAAQLAEEGIEAEVFDLRTLSPLDSETLVASVQKTGRCLVVHEAPRSCGVGAEIAALLMERALLHLQAPVERVTGFDTVMPLPKAEHFYLPDVRRIVRGAHKVMAF